MKLFKHNQIHNALGAFSAKLLDQPEYDVPKSPRRVSHALRPGSQLVEHFLQKQVSPFRREKLWNAVLGFYFSVLAQVHLRDNIPVCEVHLVSAWTMCTGDPVYLEEMLLAMLQTCATVNKNDRRIDISHRETFYSKPLRSDNSGHSDKYLSNLMNAFHG